MISSFFLLSLSSWFADFSSLSLFFSFFSQSQIPFLFSFSISFQFPCTISVHARIHTLGFIFFSYKPAQSLQLHYHYYLNRHEMICSGSSVHNFKTPFFFFFIFIFLWHFLRVIIIIIIFAKRYGTFCSIPCLPCCFMTRLLSVLLDAKFFSFFDDFFQRLVELVRLFVQFRNGHVSLSLPLSVPLELALALEMTCLFVLVLLLLLWWFLSYLCIVLLSENGRWKTNTSKTVLRVAWTIHQSF